MTQEKITPTATFNKNILNVGLYHIIQAAPVYQNPQRAFNARTIRHPEANHTAVDHANQYIEDLIIDHFKDLLIHFDEAQRIIKRLSDRWNNQTNYTHHIQPVVSMLERHIITTYENTVAIPDDTKRRQEVAYLAEIRELLLLARNLLDPVFAVKTDDRVSMYKYKEHFVNPPAFKL